MMTRLLAHKEEEEPWRHEYPMCHCDTSAGGLIRYQASEKTLVLLVSVYLKKETWKCFTARASVHWLKYFKKD